MRLRDVWDHLTPELRRAFLSCFREYPRVSTRTILGALTLLDSQDPTVRLIQRIGEVEGVELQVPSELLEDPDPLPEEIPDLSPALEETLNFFRIHHMRNITPARLAWRLLQIGSGSTVLTLEDEGKLGDFQQQLGEIVEQQRS